jgi:hypothetical protein
MKTTHHEGPAGTGLDLAANRRPLFAPWKDVPNAVSPFPIDRSAGWKFYRVKRNEPRWIGHCRLDIANLSLGISVLVNFSRGFRE